LNAITLVERTRKIDDVICGDASGCGRCMVLDEVQ
jgi:hypothetical protein